MKKVFVKASLALLSVMMLTACNENVDNPTGSGIVVNMLPETQTLELTSDQKALVQKNNDFAFNLYRTISQQAEQKKSNILSPLSVTYLLGMLNDGAAGVTAKEITAMLGFSESDVQTVNEFCQTLIEGLPKVDPSVSLTIANYIAANSHMGVQLESQFQKDMDNYYHAETASLDFSSPDALKTINGWCSLQTDGKIDKILDKLDASTLLVLMNAVNFKATWTSKFSEEDTATETFQKEGGTETQLPMMHRKAAIFYTKNDIYSSLLLSYGGNNSKWSMTVLLPQEGKTVEDVLESLTADSWKKNRGNMTANRVDIKIPRFTTSSDNDLMKPIAALGAPSIFDPEKADFSKMCTNYKELYVALMKQKANVEVNEKGTELVAVTVASFPTSDGPGMKEPEYIDFHCNRPFVYVIQESSTGAIFGIGTFRG